MVEHALGNRSAQQGHALGKPWRHMPAMQWEIGNSGALHAYYYELLDL